ncbi:MULTISPECIES: DUF6221 family protein [unclassified Streptomyces]|uniref:DUF6221 family protein n=1 Tax=unclassified Streptomyces TaxID=2593676 RepID=UPI003322C9AF
MTDARVPFLRDRYAEEERIARTASGDLYCVLGQVEYVDREVQRDEAHIAHHDPAHVLADLEARRKALDACAYFLHDGEDGPDPCAEAVLTAFVQPYAGHPDFEQEWAP